MGNAVRAALVDHVNGLVAGWRSLPNLVCDPRLGKINDEGEFETQARAAGVRDRAKLTRIKQRVLWQPLQYQVWRMSLEDGLRVFDLANESERVLLAPVLADKTQRVFDAGRLDPETTRRYVRLLGPYLTRALAGEGRRP